MKRKRKGTIALTTAAAAVAALAVVQSGAAGPGSLGAFFFGPGLVRAEVILNESGQLHDYRVDRGRIVAVAPASLTLLERDGTSVAVPVASNAVVRFDGVRVQYVRLRRGVVATTIRDGDAPASFVLAGRV